MSDDFYDAMSVPLSLTPASESTRNSTAGAAADGKVTDGTYEKAILSGEIKVDPKLGEDNYQTWSETMELLLSARMLWDKIDGTTLCPVASTRPTDNKAWKFDDTQARMWIYMNCEQGQQVHLRGAKTSLDAWEALKKVHGAKHQGRINHLMRKFYNYKAKDDESVSTVVAELRNIQLSIREINEAEAPTELATAVTLINAINEETYQMAIFHLNREAKLTVGMALESLKLVEQSLKDKEEGERLDNAQRATGNDREEKNCFHCQRAGHVKTYCFDWLDNTPEGRAYAQENPNPRRPPPPPCRSSSHRQDRDQTQRGFPKSASRRPPVSSKRSSTSQTHHQGSKSKAKAAAAEEEGRQGG